VICFMLASDASGQMSEVEMAKSAFVPQKWRMPAPLGYGVTIDSIGAVASPLLAGFSLASVIVVGADSAKFRWPGATILGLTLAAIMLIGAVQCAFNGRAYLWSESNVREWWPDVKDSPKLKMLLQRHSIGILINGYAGVYGHALRTTAAQSHCWLAWAWLCHPQMVLVSKGFSGGSPAA
jgi:hypothetical protein